jgi:hypothetical protein
LQLWHFWHTRVGTHTSLGGVTGTSRQLGEGQCRVHGHLDRGAPVLILCGQ